MRQWVLALMLSAAAPAAAQDQASLDRLADTLGYRFTIVDNQPKTCPNGSGCFVSEITITVPAQLPAGIERPEIRFGYVSRILSVESDTFDSRLINGDLNALTVKPGKRLQPGQSYRVRIIGTGHFFSRVYVMPNAHLVVPGLEPRVIAATRTGLDAETGLETLPFVPPLRDPALATANTADRTRWLTPERAFERYAARGQATTPDVVILPKPASIQRPAGAPTDLTGGLRVTVQGFAKADLAPALAAVGGEVSRGGTPVRIVKTRGLPSEGYRLQLGDGAVRIEAADAAGANHALRSLAQQARHEGGRLRPLAVEDAPRLAFRGLHVDVARNFHSKAEILKLVEQMAAYKLNKLHLHLGDDEGWRLEVKALPEVTEIGGFRCLDTSERTCLQPQLGADPARDAPVNGFFSQDDYLEILAAAKARQIEVIPSFDMPGHSRAAIRSMEVRYDRLRASGRTAEAERFRLREPADTTRYRSIQNYDDNTLNVCREETYRFLGMVVDEVAALHRRAGTPLTTYHIGADETAGAWSQSPSCQAMMARTGLKPQQLGAHFIERVSKELAAKRILVAGWSDGMGHTATERMPNAVQSNIWGGLFTGGVAEAHDQLNRGWRVVLSMPDIGYLDMPYAPDPEERGYDWAAREVELFQIFAFMPDNLPANASLRTNILSQPVPLRDDKPRQSNRNVAGMQAQLWSETVRSDAQVDYMLFPRLLGLAERAWAPKPAWEPGYVAGTSFANGDGKVDLSAVQADWREFTGRAGAALTQLDRSGLEYRLAPPGARIVAGRLEANSELPGVPIEYREGDGAWKPYAGPVAVRGPVSVRTRSPDGRRPGRAVAVGS
jgi:hexosaminidase